MSGDDIQRAAAPSGSRNGSANTLQEFRKSRSHRSERQGGQLRHCAFGVSTAVSKISLLDLANFLTHFCRIPHPFLIHDVLAKGLVNRLEILFFARKNALS